MGQGQNSHNIQFLSKGDINCSIKNSKSRLTNSHNIQFLSTGGSCNIRFLLYTFGIWKTDFADMEGGCKHRRMESIFPFFFFFLLLLLLLHPFLLCIWQTDYADTEGWNTKDIQKNLTCIIFIIRSNCPEYKLAEICLRSNWSLRPVVEDQV